MLFSTAPLPSSPCRFVVEDYLDLQRRLSRFLCKQRLLLHAVFARYPNVTVCCSLLIACCARTMPQTHLPDWERLIAPLNVILTFVSSNESSGPIRYHHVHVVSLLLLASVMFPTMDCQQHGTGRRYFAWVYSPSLQGRQQAP